MLTATTAVLCLGLILPMNLLQDMPLGLNLLNVAFGLVGAFCCWQSLRGRHHILPFLFAAVLLLDVAWFLNAGSQGSVTFFFFPVLLFAVVMSGGVARFGLVVALILNVSVLFLVEDRFPVLATPFNTPGDRLLDLITGIIAGFAALAVMAGLILMSHDREQRRIRQIAAQLTESEQKHREIFNSTNDAMFVHRPSGEVVDLNAPACAMFGFDRATGLRLSINEYSFGESPYSVVEARKLVQAAVTQGPQVFEWRSRRLNRELFWSEVALRACEIAGERRIIATVRDISERKKMEAEILRSQRLEAVGTLAGGVAHDLNNILTPILMASEILQNKLADPEDRELMAMLHKGGQRGAAIVKQLLAFSRSMAEARVILDPRGVIRETAAAVRARFPSNISVLEQNGEDLGRILAEPAQLRQVLMNLCANARDAMPGGGVLTLGLERVQVPTQPLSESGALRGGAYLVISVSDTGRGISPEDIERIFDPFFTTKEIGNGIGLGLATVHGIVKAHRGLVRVESTPGQGARFRVFLPAANAPTQ